MKVRDLISKLRDKYDLDDEVLVKILDQDELWIDSGEEYITEEEWSRFVDTAEDDMSIGGDMTEAIKYALSHMQNKREKNV